VEALILLTVVDVHLVIDMAFRTANFIRARQKHWDLTTPIVQKSGNIHKILPEIFTFRPAAYFTSSRSAGAACNTTNSITTETFSTSTCRTHFCSKSNIWTRVSYASPQLETSRCEVRTPQRQQRLRMLVPSAAPALALALAPAQFPTWSVT
jgi:hypothetical protein